MESPPPLPAPEPLGRAFWILLVAPVASMALAAGLAAVDDSKNGAAGGIGMILSLATLLAMLVCSILCAITVGKRKGLGFGLLTFLGIQIVYIGVAFAGCASVMNGMSFH